MQPGNSMAEDSIKKIARKALFQLKDGLNEFEKECQKCKRLGHRMDSRECPQHPSNEILIDMTTTLLHQVFVCEEVIRKEFQKGSLTEETTQSVNSLVNWKTLVSHRFTPVVLDLVESPSVVLIVNTISVPGTHVIDFSNLEHPDLVLKLREEEGYFVVPRNDHNLEVVSKFNAGTTYYPKVKIVQTVSKASYASVICYKFNSSYTRFKDSFAVLEYPELEGLGPIVDGPLVAQTMDSQMVEQSQEQILLQKEAPKSKRSKRITSKNIHVGDFGSYRFQERHTKQTSSQKNITCSIRNLCPTPTTVDLSKQPQELQDPSNTVTVKPTQIQNRVQSSNSQIEVRRSQRTRKTLVQPVVQINVCYSFYSTILTLFSLKSINLL